MEGPVRYATPTGAPCPRSLRIDGTVEGSGDCGACGCCLLLADQAWPSCRIDDHATTNSAVHPTASGTD